jgi:hypothetical protein
MRRTRTETPQSDRKTPQSDCDRSSTTAVPLRDFSDNIPERGNHNPSVDPNISFAPPEGVDPKAPNNRLLAAASRNEVCLKAANLADEDLADEDTLLGEPNCCSNDPNCFLPVPIVGPNNNFQFPPWFLKEIAMIAASLLLLAPSKSSVWFDVSPKAAKHNASLLSNVDCDFEKFFKTQTESTLAFGSEFRPVEQLRPLLCQHPGFDELAEILMTGMPHCHSKDITEEE